MPLFSRNVRSTGTRTGRRLPVYPRSGASRFSMLRRRARSVARSYRAPTRRVSQRRPVYRRRF